jgi:hypothetical protein
MFNGRVLILSPHMVDAGACPSQSGLCAASGARARDAMREMYAKAFMVVRITA